MTTPDRDATLKHLVFPGVPLYGLVAANKIISEKGKVATTQSILPVLVIINNVNGFRESIKKQEVDFDLLSMMAPLTVQSCNMSISLYKYLSG